MFFSLKWLYFSARAVSSLSRIIAMRSSDVMAVNFAGKTSPTSLFRFPVTCAHSLFPASDVEEAYPPTLELVDSDKKGDSDIEIDWTL